MICLRCGHCCTKYMVPVVIDMDGNWEDESNILFLYGDGDTCPHLKGGAPGEYSCDIHDHPKYKDTPCFRHDQVETKNINCRVGERVLGRKGDTLCG